MKRTEQPKLTQQGLHDIHTRDIVHLDIKPGNILIASNGRLKIADFGLAAQCPVSNEEEREGDRTYLAPELWSDGEIDKPADIFRYVCCPLYYFEYFGYGSKHSHLMVVSD